MFHTVYKTTNKFNGRFYIGYHATFEPFDDYLGSGKSLKSAIKKYGKDKFSKILLYVGLNETLALEIEKDYLGWQYFENPICYNQVQGGGKPPLQRGKPGWTRGKKLSEEHRRNLSLCRTGKKQSAAWVENRMKHLRGRKVTQETRDKIAKAHLGSRRSNVVKGNILVAQRSRRELERTFTFTKNCELCNKEFQGMASTTCCSRVCIAKRYEECQKTLHQIKRILSEL